MKVKICGIQHLMHAEAAVQAGADALGFVFASSKRQISMEKAKELIAVLPGHVEKVGVFVNESKEAMEKTADYCGLTMLQLHGDESDGLCRSLSLPVIKAIGMDREEDVTTALTYSSPFILADSPKGTYYGGNGRTFDWTLASRLCATGQKVILAGGLTAVNVREAISAVKPYMVDVSSGVETDGRKDVQKIKAFINYAKGANS
ncbi:phosphoribosylanthranilate isomerase [Bacillus sp. 1P06AnD]|uniref:phosphoribosylanthranilate isomerase n=1 Tax=Bacillus sp. 1P06AnD TaxID=3132208 RepID=UPI0039A1AEBF